LSVRFDGSQEPITLPLPPPDELLELPLLLVLPLLLELPLELPLLLVLPLPLLELPLELLLVPPPLLLELPLELPLLLVLPLPLLEPPLELLLVLPPLLLELPLELLLVLPPLLLELPLELLLVLPPLLLELPLELPLLLVLPLPLLELPLEPLLVLPPLLELAPLLDPLLLPLDDPPSGDPPPLAEESLQPPSNATDRTPHPKVPQIRPVFISNLLETLPSRARRREGRGSFRVSHLLRVHVRERRIGPFHSRLNCSGPFDGVRATKKSPATTSDGRTRMSPSCRMLTERWPALTASCPFCVS
jgi:hypothetical protein